MISLSDVKPGATCDRCQRFELYNSSLKSGLTHQLLYFAALGWHCVSSESDADGDKYVCPDCFKALAIKALA